MCVAVQFEGLKRRFGRPVALGGVLIAALSVAACSSGVSRFDSLTLGSRGNDGITTASLPPIPSEPVYGTGAPPQPYSTVAKTSPAPLPTARPPRVERAPLPPVARAPEKTHKRITIRRGNTLLGLAREHGVSVARIKDANGMKDSRLRIGQTIVIPGDHSHAPKPRGKPKTYTVMNGDSIFGIARRHGVDHRRLAKHNKLTKPGSIRPGQVLKIPGQTATDRPVRVAALNWSPARSAVPVPKAKPRVRRVRTTRIPPPSAGAPAAKATRSAASASRAPVAKPKPKPKPKKIASIATLPKPKPMTGNDFRWPVRGRIISGYGVKRNGAHNDGINVAVPRGTSVKAAENGVVAYSGNELKGYGNLILVRHANNWVTAYAHNDKLLVKRGDSVRRGQIIAKAGKSGSVSQPQLHFELRKGSRPVDPLKHMADS